MCVILSSMVKVDLSNLCVEEVLEKEIFCWRSLDILHTCHHYCWGILDHILYLSHSSLGVEEVCHSLCQSLCICPHSTSPSLCHDTCPRSSDHLFLVEDSLDHTCHNLCHSRMEEVFCLSHICLCLHSNDLSHSVCLLSS